MNSSDPRNPYSDNDNHRDKWTTDDPHVPYRGGVIHYPGQQPPVWDQEPDPNKVGNEATNENVEIPHADEGWPDENEPNWQQAVPVIPVSEPPRNYRNLARFSSYYVATRPERIVGGHEDTFRVALRNTEASDGDTVYLAHDNSVSTITGYPLAPGVEIEVSSQDDIYAICASGENATVGIIIEMARKLT